MHPYFVRSIELAERVSDSFTVSFLIVDFINYFFYKKSSVLPAFRVGAYDSSLATSLARSLETFQSDMVVLYSYLSVWRYQDRNRFLHLVGLARG